MGSTTHGEVGTIGRASGREHEGGEKGGRGDESPSTLQGKWKRRKIDNHGYIQPLIANIMRVGEGW